MSVYVLVGGLRRWLAGAAPFAPAISARWLRAGFFASLVAYAGLKIAGAFVHLPPAVDLAIAPAGLCALALTFNARTGEALDDAAQALRPALLAAAVLVAFTTTYITLNTVPMTSAQDESAIINGAHELATSGSLRVTDSLNDKYHTNIVGALDVTYRTPADMYHRVFPGTALSYAPFAQLPGDSGYHAYTALFAAAAIVALYLLAWKLLRSWWAAALATLVFAVSPAFGHWASTVYNNVPVLSLELSALALVLWSSPPKGWQLAFAGILMTLAVFMRVTEFIFVPPMLFLVWWRCHSAVRCLPFVLTAFACIPLVLATNAIFFHSPFFFPHVGSGYLPLEPSGGPTNSQSLVERYFLYVLGVSGSSSNFHPTQKLQNLFFHIRYLGSSTFAFPFLALAFTGLVWWVASRRRNPWLLALLVSAAVLAILFLYGHQHNNYYGYGLPIARSSFVRYSLPIYALLAIAAGAFFLETTRLLHPNGAAARSAVLAMVAVVGMVGVTQSYDWHVYGFNRLNYAREHDRQAWQTMDSYLQGEQPVMLIVGSNSMKLVNSADYPDTINYSILDETNWDQSFFPVVTQSLEDRRVYLIISTIQPESAAAFAAFDKRFFLNEVIRKGSWALYNIEQPIYKASP